MLDKRLMSAAKMVRKGSLAVDVGTDHGYLSVYLVENGIAGSCIMPISTKNRLLLQ